MKAPYNETKKSRYGTAYRDFFVLIYFLLLFYSHSIVEGGFEEMS